MFVTESRELELKPPTTFFLSVFGFGRGRLDFAEPALGRVWNEARKRVSCSALFQQV